MTDNQLVHDFEYHQRRVESWEKSVNKAMRDGSGLEAAEAGFEKASLIRLIYVGEMRRRGLVHPSI